MEIYKEHTKYKDVNMTDAPGTSTTNLWNQPVRIDVSEYHDRIEFTYKETSTISYMVNPSPPPEVRVFKIVFSCVDGKWNKSERIYGKIIPSQNERYEFEDAREVKFCDECGHQTVWINGVCTKFWQ